MNAVPEQILGGWLDAWAKVRLRELRAQGFTVDAFCSDDPQAGGLQSQWRVDIRGPAGERGSKAYHDLEMAFNGAVADLEGTPYPLPVRDDH